MLAIGLSTFHDGGFGVFWDGKGSGMSLAGIKVFHNVGYRVADNGNMMGLTMLIDSIKKVDVDYPNFVSQIGEDRIHEALKLAMTKGDFSCVAHFCEQMGMAGISCAGILGKDGISLLSREFRKLLSQGRLEEILDHLHKISKCKPIMKKVIPPSLLIAKCIEMQRVDLAHNYATLYPNQLTCYNIMIREFGARHDLESAFTVFHLIRQAGIQPDMFSYCTLIDACGQCGEVKRAIYTFEEMIKTGQKPNVYVYNSAMNVHANNIGHVLRLYKHMKHAGVSADSTTYNIMLKSCYLRKNIKLALHLFKDMEVAKASGNVKPDIFTYSTMIKLFGEAKMLESVVKIKNDMIRSGVALNVVSWTCFIGAFANAGLLEKAFQAFHEMLDAECIPNAQTYNILIDACIKGGQSDRAFRLFKEWKDTGKIIIGHSYCEERGTQTIQKDNSTELRTLKCHYFQPNIVTYNTMMKACDDSPDCIMELMNEMKTLGLLPNTKSWSALITAYANKSNLNGALEAFEQMGLAGVAADVITYTSIIKACVNSGNVDRGFVFLQEMKNAGICPNTVTYNTLLKAHRELGNLREVQQALYLYEEMRKAGYPPNDSILKHLIEEWAEGVIRVNGTRADVGFVKNEVFKDYIELLLKKVASDMNYHSSSEGIVIDIRGLSEAEARTVVLAILRTVKECHNKYNLVQDDLILITGRTGGVQIRDTIIHMLHNELGIPVIGSQPYKSVIESTSDEHESHISIKRPIDLVRLRISRDALNSWILKRN